MADARRSMLSGVPWMPHMHVQSERQPFRHGKSFNFLFADGHVLPVKRSDFTNLNLTARNWNRDYEPHPENW